MHVDRPGVHLRVRRGLVDRAQHAAGAALDDARPTSPDAAQRDVVGGPVRARPVPARPAAGAGSRARRGRPPAAARCAPNSARSASVSGSSAAAAARWGPARTGCPGRDRGLDRPAEQRLGVVHQVGVERVVARRRAPPATARPTARPGRPAARARPVPGQPASSTASSPLTSMPSSRALVAASPSSCRRAGAARAPGAPRAGNRPGRPRPRRQLAGHLGERAPGARGHHLDPARDRAKATVCTPPAPGRPAGRPSRSRRCARRTAARRSPPALPSSRRLPQRRRSSPPAASRRA